MDVNMDEATISGMKRRFDEMFQECIDDLNCPVCMEMLPPDFIHLGCSHRVCSACWTRVDNKRCPTCRYVQGRRKPGHDRVLGAILQNYPRMVECGTLVPGGMILAHQDNCLACFKKKFEEKVEDYEQLLETYNLAKKRIEELESQELAYRVTIDSLRNRVPADEIIEDSDTEEAE
jgi:hypothetical protein